MKSLKNILKEIVDQKIIKEEEGLKGLYRLCKEKGYKEREEQFENEFIALLLTEVEKSSILDENELEDIAGGAGKLGKKFASAALSILGLASGFAPSMGAVNTSGTSVKQTATNVANQAKDWVTKNPGTAATIASGGGLVGGALLIGGGIKLAKSIGKDSATVNVDLSEWTKEKSNGFSKEILDVSDKLTALPEKLEEQNTEGETQENNDAKTKLKEQIEDINKTINESENLQEFFTKAAGQSFAEFNNEIGKFVSVKEGTADADNANPEENVDQIDFTNYNKQEILKKWEAVLESSRKVLENNIELPGIKVMVNAMSESHAKVLEQLGGDATAKKAEYDNIIKLIEAKEEEKEEEAAPDGTHGPAERNPGDSTANATFTETLNAIGETIGNIETKVGELNSSNDFTGINALLGIEAKHASGIGALLAGTQTNISALKPSDDDQTQAVNGLKERLNNAEKEFNTALNNFRIKYIQHKVQNDILQPLKDLNSATARTGHKWEQVTDKGMDLKNYSTLKENPSGVNCLINVLRSNINFFILQEGLGNFVAGKTDTNLEFNLGRLNRLIEKNKNGKEQKEKDVISKVHQIMEAGKALFGDTINNQEIAKARRALVDQALKEIKSNNQQ